MEKDILQAQASFLEEVIKHAQTDPELSPAEKALLQASYRIVRQIMDPDGNPPRFTAGYEAGYYYVKPSLDTHVSALKPILAQGYTLRLDMHGILLKKR